MDKAREYSIDYKNIEVTSNEIISSIGYLEPVIPEMVLLQIHNVRNEVDKYCQIKGGFRIINDIVVENNHFILEGITFQTDKIIARSLRQADSIAIFVCTVGEELSARAGNLFKGEDPVKAYITDIAASLIVEKAADRLAHFIEESALAHQKQITNRYSPGYCDWHVSEQHKLLGLLPENFCGVSLNEAAMMSPVKSVSGVIGIGKKVKKTAYQCSTCEKTDCLMAYKQ